MKKYTLSIILLTMFILGFQTTYAAEDVTTDNEADLLDEFDLGQAPVFKFSVVQNNESLYPVSGASIKLYYRDGEQFVELGSMYSEYQGMNLVSNENGEIVLNQLPFGFYKYEVGTCPMGLEPVESVGTFDVTPMEYIETIDIGLKMKISEVTEKPVEKPTTQEPVVEEKPQEGPVVEENNASTQISNTQDYTPTIEQVQVLGNLYESAKEDFEVKEEAQDVDVENIPITATIPIKIQLSKTDVIMAMRNIRITEQIRLATVMDMHGIGDYITRAYLPRHGAKTKRA